MSANRLGPRKLRKIAAVVGEPIDRAQVWSHVYGGRWAVFVTAGGRKGRIDRHTGEWEWDS